jgi:hypothetical protein
MNGGVTVHDLLDEALVMSGLSDLFVVSSKMWLLLFLDRGTKKVSRHGTESSYA